MAYQVEVTDTFCGEANYSWVSRYTVHESVRGEGWKERKLMERRVVRAAKRAAGWANLRCTTDYSGNMIEVRPIGRRAPCLVMFITWQDDDASTEESDS